jgi:raffinose/stachyose/melibiose transport system permease protein
MSRGVRSSLVLFSPSRRSLPLSIFSFFTEYSVDFAPLMVGLVLTIIPVIVVYIVERKYIIEEVLLGAIK